MTLDERSERIGVLQSTCSNIIRTAKQRANDNGNQDLCATENLVPLPNSVKGFNQALTDAQKAHLVETALKDAEHCRITFSQLVDAGKVLYFIFYIFFSN